MTISGLAITKQHLVETNLHFLNLQSAKKELQDRHAFRVGAFAVL